MGRTVRAQQSADLELELDELRMRALEEEQRRRFFHKLVLAVTWSRQLAVKAMPPTSTSAGKGFFS